MDFSYLYTALAVIIGLLWLPGIFCMILGRIIIAFSHNKTINKIVYFIAHCYSKILLFLVNLAKNKVAWMVFGGITIAFGECSYIGSYIEDYTRYLLQISNTYNGYFTPKFSVWMVIFVMPIACVIITVLFFFWFWFISVGLSAFTVAIIGDFDEEEEEDIVRGFNGKFIVFKDQKSEHSRDIVTYSDETAEEHYGRVRCQRCKYFATCSHFGDINCTIFRKK